MVYCQLLSNKKKDSQDVDHQIYNRSWFNVCLEESYYHLEEDIEENVYVNHRIY